MYSIKKYYIYTVYRATKWWPTLWNVLICISAPYFVSDGSQVIELPETSRLVLKLNEGLIKLKWNDTRREFRRCVKLSDSRNIVFPLGMFYVKFNQVFLSLVYINNALHCCCPRFITGISTQVMGLWSIITPRNPSLCTCRLDTVYTLSSLLLNSKLYICVGFCPLKTITMNCGNGLKPPCNCKEVFHSSFYNISPIV